MKSKRLKIVSTCLAIALILSLAAGCGSSPSNSATAPSSNSAAAPDAAKAPSKAGGKLELITSQPDLNDGTYAQFEAFKQKTGIEIVVEQLPTDQFSNLVLARAATNDLSDLLAFHVGANLGALNPEANLIDVTNEPYIKNLDEQYIRCATVNGKLYGPPVLPVNAGGVVYNAKVYKELGLEVPKTWDELMANCQTVKEKGKIPVVGTLQVTSTAQMIWLSDFYNVAAKIPDFPEQYVANKLRLTDVPIYVRSFEKMTEVYQKGFYNKDYLSTGRDAGLTMLAKGEAVHYFGLSREINNIARNTPELINDIGFFAQPSDDPNVHGLTIWMPHGYYIPKTVKNLEGAKLFQEFMSSPESVDAYVSKAIPTGPFLVKNAKMPDNMYPAIKSAVEYVNTGKTYPAQEFVSPIKGPNTPQICVEASTGAKTAIEAAKAIDEDNTKYAKQLGLPGW